MLTFFVFLILPEELTRDHGWEIYILPTGLVCWLGAWIASLAFNENDAHNTVTKCQQCKKCCVEFVRLSLMVIFLFGLIAAIGYGLGFQNNSTQFFNKIFILDIHGNNGNNGNGNNNEKYGKEIKYSIYNIVLSVFFGVMLMCIECFVIKKYRSNSINIRYYFFNVQLCICFLLVLVFFCSYIWIGLMVSLLLCLWHVAIVWNDLLHKKMINLSKIEYVNKYRPSVAATRRFQQFGIFKSCHWIVKCYIGLLFGHISMPQYPNDVVDIV
ncbi:hypothetical protein RFI_16375 [Reticulomyxa filosa]|uniref:Uncharacterized protein n=1 Tax=Reticulomyxa filosa TaxID=46433 RepID=X6N507_RETFI|nr:hypothetical protein RFI_16375 [Reticulomyxa filosa]|eukprot:ETO20834.1 hypothetical protein RFI_16375 [Reticulomyxa filosa]